MTNAKNTKRALLLSILSVMLCCAMFIGTSFAWFTDSVASGNNKIVAGNLAVELYHANGNTTDEKVEETTNLFTDKDGNAILWEPGVMVYENFTVKNAGSLALKYRLTISADNFNTVDGKSLKDVLKVAVLDGAFSGDRDAAQALTFDKTIADFEKTGNIAAGAADHTYAVVIYWEPTAADNDYNLSNGKESNDGKPLFIDLGVNLAAAQDTVESDSFDKNYDADAEYPAATASSVDELKAAIKPGATIVLSDNIDIAASGYSIDNPFLVDADNVTLDLNGKEICTSWLGLKVTGENVTIKNGTIKRQEGKDFSYGIRLNGINTVMENVTIDSGINVSGYNDDDSVKPGVSAKIVNCTINLDGDQVYYAVCTQGESSAIVENVEINRTNPGKANYYFWVEKEFTDELGYVGNSYIGINQVTMNSTCGTTLFNPVGLEPEDLTITDNEFEDPFA